MNTDFSIKVDGQEIAGLIENPGQETLIILIHGFTGNMHGPVNIFDKLSERLQSQGYSVLRFNFRGTPPSEGEFIDMTLDSETKDLEEVMKFAKTLGSEKTGILGESMGGAIIANLPKVGFDFIIFWYSVFEFMDCAFRECFSAESQKLLKERGYLVEDGFKYGEKFINQIPMVNLYDRLSEISCPTLFLHGDSDTDVPIHQSEKAFEIVLAKKEIHILKGADHCFENEQDEAIDLTVNFIEGLV